MPTERETRAEGTHPCETGLPPVRGQSPEVVILGSFPSRLSLLHHEYYGNPQNQFWRIIQALFHIDRSLPYRIRTSLLTGQGIALWDVISACRRVGSADTRIRDPVFHDLVGFFRSCPDLRFIVLNGTTAGRFFNSLKIPVGVPVAILPSTSPANTRFTLDEKVRRWEIILAQRE